MKRISYLVWGVALLAAITPIVASATVVCNDVYVKLRHFNDGPFTTLTSYENYPTEIWIEDVNVGYTGWANFHNWSYSEYGTAPAVFWNGDSFRSKATLKLTGNGYGEAGLRVSPWWALDDDGRFNVKLTPGGDSGEVAVFGGRLPFYSFTANHGVVYQRGDEITLEVLYQANWVDPLHPGTMTYTVTYGANTYSSGPIAMDQGNLSEAPLHGLFGILDTARVGGYFQFFLEMSSPDLGVRATWTNIEYEPLAPIPVEETTWGRIKSQY